MKIFVLMNYVRIWWQQTFCYCFCSSGDSGSGPQCWPPYLSIWSRLIWHPRRQSSMASLSLFGQARCQYSGRTTPLLYHLLFLCLSTIAFCCCACSHINTPDSVSIESSVNDYGRAKESKLDALSIPASLPTSSLSSKINTQKPVLLVPEPKPTHVRTSDPKVPINKPESGHHQTESRSTQPLMEPRHQLPHHHRHLHNMASLDQAKNLVHHQVDPHIIPEPLRQAMEQSDKSALFDPNNVDSAATKKTPMNVNQSGSSASLRDLDVNAFVPPGYDKLMPPKENGNPTKVRFHVWVLGLDSIDEGSMTYVADIFISQSWKDNRLVIPQNITFNVNTSSDPRGPYRLLPLTLIDKIWRPDSFFKNAKEVTFQEMTIPNHYIWLYSDHTILYMVKLTLLLSCAMKFQTYPHDTQNCTLKIESLSYTTKDLVFDWEESDPLVVEEHIELPQHDLINQQIDYCTTNYSSGVFACVQVIFTIKRRLGYYIFHTYIPTCLIVIMSWISFWIKPEAVPARVTLCVTSLLTLSTQHAQSQKSLPPVSYIKAIDIFMSSCTVFVFASLMEYALVNILMSDELLNGWIGIGATAYDGPSARSEGSGEPPVVLHKSYHHHHQKHTQSAGCHPTCAHETNVMPDDHHAHHPMYSTRLNNLPSAALFPIETDHSSSHQHRQTADSRVTNNIQFQHRFRSLTQLNTMNESLGTNGAQQELKLKIEPTRQNTVDTEVMCSGQTNRLPKSRRLRRIHHSWSLLSKNSRNPRPPNTTGLPPSDRCYVHSNRYEGPCEQHPHNGSQQCEQQSAFTCLRHQSTTGRTHQTLWNRKSNTANSKGDKCGLGQSSNSSDNYSNGGSPTSSPNSQYLQKKHQRAYVVDHVSRWIFPLSFVILNVGYWAYYLDLFEAIKEMYSEIHLF